MIFTIPSVGDVVFAQVLRVSSKGAECRILGKCLGQEVVCIPNYRGLIRPTDVATPTLMADIPLPAFRPADVVRAKVISLGDGKAVFLSTVPEDCGVVSSGKATVAASYKLLTNEDRTLVLSRKVAKPRLS